MMYIYKTTNLVNGKTYVGQYTDLSNSFDTYLGGGKLIRKAVKKYGKQNFKKEILISGVFNKLLLNELEKHYIRLYSPVESSNSYNLDIGGNTNNKTCKKVYQYGLDGKFIKIYDTVKEAASSCNLTTMALRTCIQRGISSKGFIWTYNTEDVSDRVSKVKKSALIKSISRSSGTVYVFYSSKWNEYTSCIMASKHTKISLGTITSIIHSKSGCGWSKDRFISNQLYEVLPERNYNNSNYYAIKHISDTIVIKYNTIKDFSVQERIPISTARKYWKQGRNKIINGTPFSFVEI